MWGIFPVPRYGTLVLMLNTSLPASTIFPDSIHKDYGQLSNDGNSSLEKIKNNWNQFNKHWRNVSSKSFSELIAGDSVLNKLTFYSPMEPGYEAIGIKTKRWSLGANQVSKNVHRANIFSVLCSFEEYCCSSAAHFVHEVSNKIHAVLIKHHKLSRTAH